MKNLYSLALILAVLFISGCNRLNENPPEYIKDVVVYKEGIDGLFIYFILADESGAMTTSDGMLSLTIYEKYRKWYGAKFLELEKELYTSTFNIIKKTDFQKTTVGIGSFEREEILYSFGRLTYSSFAIKPNTDKYGIVRIEFTCPDGRILKGECPHFGF